MITLYSPSAHRAHPEYEFRTVITTGMSAPPIADVRVIPITVDIKEVAPNSPNPLAMDWSK